MHEKHKADRKLQRREKEQRRKLITKKVRTKLLGYNLF